MHEHVGTFTLVPKATLPHVTRVPRPVWTFTRKLGPNGNVSQCKARIAYPDDRLQPGLHLDPKTIATYFADRDSIRAVLALAACQKLTLRHIDITSAYLHEPYVGPTPIYCATPVTLDGQNPEPCPQHRSATGPQPV